MCLIGEEQMVAILGFIRSTVLTSGKELKDEGALRVQ